jgi:hypothetical protein
VQMIWGVPARFCKEILTDNIPLNIAARKADMVFSKWLQGVGHEIDLNMKQPGQVLQLSLFPASVFGGIRCVHVFLCSVSMA